MKKSPTHYPIQKTIKTLQKAKGFNNTQMSEALGVTPQYYRHFLSERFSMDLYMVEQVEILMDDELDL